MANLKHYGWVDALRGWAIIGVMLVHFTGKFGVPFDILEPLAQQGARGVQLFFIASSFTLTTSFIARKEDENALKSYFIRRFFRIAPLYYVAAGLWYYIDKGSISHFSPSGVDINDIFLNLAFLHGWHYTTINALVPGGWSIAVEMNFYLILPILATKIQNLRGAVWVFLIGSCAAIVVSAVMLFFTLEVTPHAELAKSYYGTMWLGISVPAFLAGILLYWLLQRYNNLIITPAKVCWAWLSVIVGMLVLCYVSFPLKGVIFCPIAVLFAILVSCGQCPRFLTAKIIQSFGKYSFSLYVTHFIVLRLLVIFGYDFLNYFVIAVCYVAASYVLAIVVNRILENPGQRIGTKLIDALR